MKVLPPKSPCVWLGPWDTCQDKNFRCPNHVLSRCKLCSGRVHLLSLTPEAVSLH